MLISLNLINYLFDGDYVLFHTIILNLLLVNISIIYLIKLN